MRSVAWSRIRHILDAVSNRLLYATVLGMVLLTVALVAVPIADGYAPSHEAALVVAAVLILVIELCSGHLHRFVDWLLYGHRGDAATATWRLARRLESVGDDAVPMLVEALAGTLRLSYVEVLVRDPDAPPARPEPAAALRLAAHGHRTGQVADFPIRHSGRDLGVLAASRRSVPLDQRDERLLQAAAAQLGVVLHASRLAADLQRAREQLVVSREAERARLRRELHDGVGPTLAGLALGLEAAAGAIGSDRTHARGLMAQARDDLATLIGDVRRVVDGLRPPMLDEVGLVGALAQRGNAFAARSGLAVAVHADDLPELGAAVEVAAYRIATEALTNVARHACATRCDIRLRVHDRALRLEVEDDGNGGAGPSRAGTGLVSMHERAAELGGAMTVTSTTLGTSIRVRLPIVTGGADA